MTEDYCYKSKIIEVLYKKKKRFYTAKFIYFNDATDKNLGELQPHCCPGFWMSTFVQVL